ncbi:hypothetical protein P7C70_g8845, partial [Phenoliferia sp. Uapishka_3]
MSPRPPAVLLILASIFFSAQTAPVNTTTFPDAPFVVDPADVQAAITCPKGQGKSAGGTVLLVHGTGSTGSESFGTSPYIRDLPSAGNGFDVCFIDLPGRSIVDAQISGEFVAFVKYLPRSVLMLAKEVANSKAIQLMAPQSFNPQWALVFWPSTQALVSNYVALAPDFKGTIEGAIFSRVAAELCSDTGSGVLGCNALKLPTVQNTVGNGGGGQALVKTTAIFTVYDNVVQPESGPIVSSDLQGATVMALQSPDNCGPTHLADHFSMLTDQAAFNMVSAALTGSKFQKASCLKLPDLDPAALTNTVRSELTDVLSILVAGKTPAEPDLQASFSIRGIIFLTDSRLRW